MYGKFTNNSVCEEPQDTVWGTTEVIQFGFPPPVFKWPKKKKNRVKDSQLCQALNWKQGNKNCIDSNNSNTFIQMLYRVRLRSFQTYQYTAYLEAMEKSLLVGLPLMQNGYSR